MISAVPVVPFFLSISFVGGAEVSNLSVEGGGAFALSWSSLKNIFVITMSPVLSVWQPASFVSFAGICCCGWL
uniref:Putative secreted protein n=1 Tax=Anopheles marajoara TaxID=58244 RepID=A0A2M4CDG6_9DIPT